MNILELAIHRLESYPKRQQERFRLLGLLLPYIPYISDEDTEMSEKEFLLYVSDRIRDDLDYQE